MAKKKKPTDKVKTPKEANSITGKDLILAFVGMFLVFAAIGYLRGRSIRNKPERLRLDILVRLGLGERGGKRILAYQCNGKRELAWDLDNNTLFSERPSVVAEEYTFSPAIFQNDSLTTAFLTGGGVASVFTAKELFVFAATNSKFSTSSRLPYKGHIQLILTAVFAAVSGYEVGYQIALHINSDCADPRFTPILHDPKNWIGDGKDWHGFEKTHWLFSLNVLENETHPGFCKSSDANVRASEDNKFLLALSEFNEFREGSVTAVDHDITSADFEALNKYQNALREYNQRCRF